MSLITEFNKMYLKEISLLTTVTLLYVSAKVILEIYGPHLFLFLVAMIFEHANFI